MGRQMEMHKKRDSELKTRLRAFAAVDRLNCYKISESVCRKSGEFCTSRYIINST